MRALIVNDAEGSESPDSIVHRVSCIAGHPNIAFSHIGDPLSSDAEVSQLLSQLNTPARGAFPGQSMSQMMTQQPQAQIMSNAIMSNRRGYHEPTPELESPDSDSDLYRYRFEMVALPLHGRTSLPVFSSQAVEYTDAYEVNIPPSPRYNAYGNTGSGVSELDEPPRPVAHFVRFRNGTPVPWTTAPVSTYLRGEFVSQDTMTFVPSGGAAKVKLTTALHVLCGCKENTAGRASRAETWQGSSYRRYDVEVVLTLTNATGEAVEITVGKSFFGEFKPASLKNTQPFEIKQPPRSSHFNPEQSLTFREIVPAQSQKEIKFEYVVGVRE